MSWGPLGSRATVQRERLTPDVSPERGTMPESSAEDLAPKTLLTSGIYLLNSGEPGHRRLAKGAGVQRDRHVCTIRARYWDVVL